MLLFRSFIRYFSLNTTLNKKHFAKNLKGKTLSSQLWIKRQLNDPYVERAKQMNYRCRSAFKLLEINEKHNILGPGHIVVDCGAAPGSWSQVARDFCCQDPKNKGSVIAIDKLQFYPIEDVIILGNTDFTKAHSKLKEILNDAKVNCVLSDMAPNATGIKDLDTENILNLAYSVLRFAAETSAVGASLLVKLWQCPQAKTMQQSMERFYSTVKIVKPQASRDESAEIYLLALGFKGLNEKKVETLKKIGE